MPDALKGHEVAAAIRNREWRSAIPSSPSAAPQPRGAGHPTGSGHTAILIWCTGSVSFAEGERPTSFDAHWGKPIPNAFDGTMQRMLRQLFVRAGRDDLTKESIVEEEAV